MMSDYWQVEFRTGWVEVARIHVRLRRQLFHPGDVQLPPGVDLERLTNNRYTEVIPADNEGIAEYAVADNCRTEFQRMTHSWRGITHFRMRHGTPEPRSSTTMTSASARRDTDGCSGAGGPSAPTGWATTRETARSTSTARTTTEEPLDEAHFSSTRGTPCRVTYLQQRSRS